MSEVNAGSAKLPQVAAADGAQHQGEQGELYKRLVWLAAFRIAAVTVLVGTTAVLTLQGGEGVGGRSAASLSSLAVGTNLLQIGVVLLLRLKRWLRQLALVQVLGDVAFAAALVYLTGGAESLFTFLYLLAVVNGGILLARQGAWFAAGAAFVAHIGLVLLLNVGWLAPAEGAPLAKLSWPQLYQAIFTHGAAFGLTAVVASYAASQLERAGARAEVAEDSLSKLGALHDAIVRSISSGIVTTDERDRVTFVNRAGEEILGTRAAVLGGRALEDVFPVLQGVSAGEPAGKRLECSWQRPDGTARLLGIHVNPLVDGEGRRVGSAAVFQDLTPFRDLEARAARSERLATVGELSAGLAHELRNPLASMSGSIEMLAGSSRDDDDRRLFEIVLREAGRLNALVTDFLAFARPAPPELARVSLPGLLGEVMEMFPSDPRTEGVRLESEIADARARVDPAQMKQVLWNLLLNAAQASAPGGSISLRCGPGREAGTSFFAVEDRGTGMPPELVRRIFDPFFTTKAQGTGLGLATVHRIVDAHGGQVLVESAVGQGTCFTVVLPAPQEES